MQLLTLREAYADMPRIWVSNEKSDARSLLADERAHFLPGPFSRHSWSLLTNLRFAFRLIRRERPSAILTTGADIAVPFAWVGRLYGARVIYVESFTRAETVSLSCKLIRPVAHDIYVQWPELIDSLPGAQFFGAVAVAE
jgi:UDP-N-acetylglucosamine:LPS N-acetylglucosamine transferase